MVIIEKEGLLEAGRGRGRRRGKGKGGETGTVKVSGAETGTVKVSGAETGTGTGIGNMIGIRIVTIGIEIATGIEVIEERGRGLETEMMTITTGVGIMTG